MTADEAVMTPGAMRAQADQLRAAAREQERQALRDAREAAQLAHVAALIEARDLAVAELEGARSRLPVLQGEFTAAVAAHRDADDLLLREKTRLAARRAEQAKAAAALAPSERQEELALRVAVCERVVADHERVVAAADAARQRAEQAAGYWQAHLGRLEAEAAEASRRADNPGLAPARPGLALGVDGASDLDEETRSLLGAAVALMAALPAGPAPQRLPNGDRRLSFYEQDAGQFRFARTGRGTVAVPPDPRRAARR